MTAEEASAKTLSIEDLQTLIASLELQIAQMTSAYDALKKDAVAHPDDFMITEAARKQLTKMNRLRIEIITYRKAIKQKEEREKEIRELTGATQANKNDLGDPLPKSASRRER